MRTREKCLGLLWGKVIFSVACDKNSVHRGICLSTCWDTTRPPSRHPSPRSRHPPGADIPPGPDPPGSRHPPPVNRMTNRCKNITLPQTSFAGGNKWTIDANNVWKRKYNGPRKVTFSLCTDGYFSVTLHQSQVEKMPLEPDNEGIGRDLRPWISHSYSNRMKYVCERSLETFVKVDSRSSGDNFIITFLCVLLQVRVRVGVGADR